MTDLNRLAQAVVERSPALVLYARQFLDAAAADDAVQEALVSLLSQNRPPSDVIAWMYRAVRNAAVDQARGGAGASGSSPSAEGSGSMQIPMR